MEALRLKLYQDVACYKKPMAYKVWETYPLPPYSTVIGFLHKLMNVDSYHPMNISIQGKFDTLYHNYVTTRLYKSNEVTAMPRYIHELNNVNLMIHVSADKDTIDKIIDGFYSGNLYTCIGRHEDLVRIDSVESVKLMEIDMLDREILKKEGVPYNKTDYSMYVPENLFKEKPEGIFYRLNKKYEIINDYRVWTKEKVYYMDKFNPRIINKCFYDSDKKEFALFA